MNREAVLTIREAEIAKLLAWGASKKEVADRLSISPRTVENTARRIFQKIDIQKTTELSVWWFCTRFNISFDLSPLQKKITALALMCILLPHELQPNKDAYRPARKSAKQLVVAARKGGKRSDSDVDFYDNDFEL